MTLVELMLALGLLAMGIASLVQVLTLATVRRERLWKKQQAFAAMRGSAEEILVFSGTSADLFQQYNDPPAVVVRDGDGDLAFDSGWAKVTLRAQVPSLAGETDEEIKLVFGKAE